MPNPLAIPHDALADFCRRWQITELALFGSVLRDDFHPDSDVDLCVRFHSGVGYDLDDRDRMVSELTAMFGRRVDLVPSHAVRNPFIRHEIESTKRVLYAA